MNIKHYLKEKGISVTQFCKDIGTSTAYLSLLARGKAIPGDRLARDIAKATDGVVTFDTSHRQEKRQETEKERYKRQIARLQQKVRELEKKEVASQEDNAA